MGKKGGRWKRKDDTRSSLSSSQPLPRPATVRLVTITRSLQIFFPLHSLWLWHRHLTVTQHHSILTVCHHSLICSCLRPESQLLHFAGVVPEPSSEVAQDREDMGQEHHHGGVRPVRRHGATLSTSTGYNHEVCRQRRGVPGALAPR